MNGNNIDHTEHLARARLTQSLQGMVKDAEALLRTAERNGSDEFSAARSRFQAQIDGAKSELEQLADDAGHRARRFARDAARSVQAHPYATFAIAAGAMGLIALLATGWTHRRR